SAAHEVPPHDDVLAERFPTQQEDAQVPVGPGGDLELLSAVGQDVELACVGSRLALPRPQRAAAVVDEDAVLMAGVEVEAQAAVCDEVELRHAERGRRGDGARVLERDAVAVGRAQRAESNASASRRSADLLGGVDGELARPEAGM